MGWFVYLIECRNGNIYTGIAVDVQARYAKHASGRGARYTRANPPLRLLGSFPCRDRGAASRAEAAIRRLDAARKRELCASPLDATRLRALGLGDAADAPDAFDASDAPP